MSTHLETFEDAVRAQDWTTANSEHLNFHLSIIRALQLPALELILEPLQELIIVSSIPTEPESGEQWGIGSHDPIMDALRAGDPEQARAAVREHFAYTRSARYVEHGKRSFREARTVAAERLGSPVA